MAVEGCQVTKAEATAAKPKSRVEVFVVSAYTSRRCETDSTPTITSAGEKVRPGIRRRQKDYARQGIYKGAISSLWNEGKNQQQGLCRGDIMNNRYQGRFWTSGCHLIGKRFNSGEES